MTQQHIPLSRFLGRKRKPGPGGRTLPGPIPPLRTPNAKTESNVSSFEGERLPPKEILPGKVALFLMVTERHYQT